MITLTHPAIERLPDVVVEQAFGRFVHREFPVLIARVKQAKRQRERWGGCYGSLLDSPMPQPRRGLMALFGRGL